MFNPTNTAQGRGGVERGGLRSRAARRFAPLVAALAVLSAVAGGLVESAQAGSFTDGHWAKLTVACQTYYTVTGRKQYVRISTTTSGSGIHMQTRTYVNGALTGSTGWTPLFAGGMTINDSSIATVPNGTRLQVIVQFARVVNGFWQYSPNGAFEYATHYSMLNGMQQSQGSSCLFY